MRLAWRNLMHPRALLADTALAGRDANRWLAQRQYTYCWLERDDDVRRVRVEYGPDLTLTISSRIIFTERTLNSTTGDWLNVHPGLLPRYAGASPVPYMFLDGIAGCTIHRMAVGIDTGAVVDMAQVDGDLGADGGELLYEHLPRLAAERILAVLQDWRTGRLEAREQDSRTLSHCTSAQLRRDRQLNWSWESRRLVRWVQALMPFAPAWLIDRGGQACEVRAAVAHEASVDAMPGTVLAKLGTHVHVACRGGSVWLECCTRPRLQQGDLLQGAAPSGP